jgi:hypothetical protein
VKGDGVGRFEQLLESDLLDVLREVAVDQVRVVGDHALEDRLRVVREALADAAQAQDADSHFLRARDRARAAVVPVAAVYVAVVAHDLADQCKHHRQCVQRDLAHPVVR